MKRFLIFLLVVVLALGMTTLAVAADRSDDACPLQETDKPCVAVTIPGVVEVMAVGIVGERQPVQRIIERVEAKKPLRDLIDRIKDRFKNRDRRPLRDRLLR